MLHSYADLFVAFRQQILVESAETAPTHKYGSADHISMLEAALSHLIQVRETHGRTTRSRYVMSRAIEEMRREVKKARRYGEKTGQLQRIDEE